MEGRLAEHIGHVDVVIRRASLAASNPSARTVRARQHFRCNALAKIEDLSGLVELLLPLFLEPQYFSGNRMPTVFLHP